MSTKPEPPSAADIGGIEPEVQMHDDFFDQPGREAFLAGYGPVPPEWIKDTGALEDSLGVRVEGDDAADERAEALE